MQLNVVIDFDFLQNLPDPGRETFFQSTEMYFFNTESALYLLIMATVHLRWGVTKICRNRQ